MMPAVIRGLLQDITKYLRSFRALFLGMNMMAVVVQGFTYEEKWFRKAAGIERTED